MIALLAIVTFGLMCVLIRSFIKVNGGRIFFNPLLFFLTAYTLFIFVPHLLIYFLPSFESAYIGFTRGETPNSVVSAFVLCWGWCLPVFLLRGHLRGFDSEQFDTMIFSSQSFYSAIVMAGSGLIISISINAAVFGVSRSVAFQIVSALATGNFGSVLLNYNAIRYDATKGAMLDYNIRGLGSITGLMDYSSLIVVGLAGICICMSRRKVVSILIFILSICFAIYVSLTTGMRSKLVLAIIFISIIAQFSFKWNKVTHVVGSIAVFISAFILFTIITPKVDQHENQFISFVYRLGGNAVNDCTVIESEAANMRIFQNPSIFTVGNIGTLDRQLSLYYTANPNTIWYETPTCIAGYFLQGSFLGVFINGIILGFLCCGLVLCCGRIKDDAFRAVFFALLCVVFLPMAITGWATPAALLPITLILVFYKSVGMVLQMWDERFSREFSVQSTE